MKVCAINSVVYGSTGNIMLQIADLARKEGIETYTFSMKWRNQIKKNNEHCYFGNFLENAGSIKLGKYTGLNGCFAVGGTISLLKKFDEIKPDIIHLHNLHNCYINLPMLFHYIKRKHIRVIWTLHDCWAFTGQCPHFTMIKCEKWKTGCYHCPQYRMYPSAIVDRTEKMWKLKRKWFTNIGNLLIITPSEWLAKMVKKSFLKEYPVKVVNNGIDTDVFKPTQNNFREKNNIHKRYIVLGVAFGWDKRKGLDIFIKLSEELPDNYQIVLVGIDEKKAQELPVKILTVEKTHNQKELAEIYSASDIFVNPTREDNFPTVNLEALACGTPVVTFNTGGAPECINSKTGSVVECDDVERIAAEIVRICREKPYARDECAKQGRKYDKRLKFKEYINIYKGSF